MKEYKDYIDETFQHFVKDEEYQKLYQQVCADCQEAFDHYIQTGSSSDYAHQQVIEANRLLKAKLGLKLQHKPTTLKHVDYVYSTRRMNLSNVARSLFYLVLVLTIVMMFDLYLLVWTVIFLVPVLFLLNLAIIQDSIYNIALYPVSVALYFTLYITYFLLMGYIDFNVPLLLVVLGVNGMIGFVLYLKTRYYLRLQYTRMSLWIRLSLLDFIIILLYFGLIALGI